MKAKRKGGDEYDCFSKTRKIHGYLLKPGVCKSIKNRFNRRIRRKAKMSENKGDV